MTTKGGLYVTHNNVFNKPLYEDAQKNINERGKNPGFHDMKTFSFFTLNV